MTGFIDTLSNLFDSVAAPACAQDPASGGYHQDVSWHNNFGTAADFQIPAQSNDAFPSASTGFGSGGFGDGF